jgi:hypothetical protein
MVPYPGFQRRSSQEEEAMLKQRILIVDGAPLFREMLQRVIERSLDLQVVGMVADLSDLAASVERMRADWIMLLRQPGEQVPESISRLLKQHTRLRLLIMTLGSDQIKVQWNEPHEEFVNLSTVESLVDVLRAGQLA